jgi:hypothetical protein
MNLCSLLCTTVFFVSAITLSAQGSAPESKVLLDNPEVRVTRFDVGRDAFKVKADDGDVVVVAAGEVKFTPALEANSEFLMHAGEARYVVQGSHPEVYCGAETTSCAVYAVDLRHHWQSTLRICEEPKQCSRQIKVGDMVIGETRQLFTNNYVSAYRHELEKGGTLNSSYFTSHGTDHVVFLALTPLTASFAEEQLNLAAGQVYFSNAQGVEVDASGDRALWVAIRIHAPVTAH